ncbi:MAG: dihydrofolate reductase [Acidobacteria bacterium]|nr:MAG: dihydrofolate reductase [Acidobacteriota bacterium]REK01036.1 MAG: dihydrofolate reductase [Acidobacteriota bacterium]
MPSRHQETPYSAPPIELVAAVARNRVIGREGDLPWRLADDLRRFRQLTTGHVLLAGRRTWESIGRPLPERHMLVLSRGGARAASLEGPGREHLDTLDRLAERAAAAAARTGLSADPIYCIGGAQVYALLLPRARRLHLTWVEAEVAGDERFPEVDWNHWREVACSTHVADERNEHATTHCVYERLGEVERGPDGG